jgi:hypothetical protein
MTDEELKEMIKKPGGFMAENWPNVVGELLKLRAAVRRERDSWLSYEMSRSTLVDVDRKKIAWLKDRALVDRLVAGGEENNANKT